MATRNNRRTQMTRMLLKTALTELMQKKPFGEITIKEICEQADLNRTTFYMHYDDQTALLRDIEDEVQQKTLEYLEGIRPSAEATDMIVQFLRYIQARAKLFRILLSDPGSESFRSRFLEATLENLRVGIPVQGAEDEYRYVLCFIMQGSIHVIIEWIKHDFDLPAESIASLIFRLCNKIAPET